MLGGEDPVGEVIVKERERERDRERERVKVGERGDEVVTRD